MATRTPVNRRGSNNAGPDSPCESPPSALSGQLDEQLRLNTTPPVDRENTHSTASSCSSPSHAICTPTSPDDDPLDLICVGFGPASLAIAIALHDAAQSSGSPTASASASAAAPLAAAGAAPRVLFLEKQPQFAWHAGMQLPGAKMQISFLKDLATPRDPTSRFTFLNYLFQKGRLNHFINLGTFLPTRVEYEDYLRWCAAFFESRGDVAYGMEVQAVSVGERSPGNGRVTGFAVEARDRSGAVVRRKARHVVIAVGGQPVIPPVFQGLKHVAHSSRFATTIGRIQERDAGKPLRFAVVGSGQSAAEIFNDLSTRFPDAQVKLVIRGASLRPSDDSPFVNEIFDPDHVDAIFHKSASERAAAIALDRGTNYGVVRLELLEHLYERLYMQRLRTPDEKKWPCRIIPNRVVISAYERSDSSIVLKLSLPDEAKREDRLLEEEEEEEEMEVDYVFTATGYLRNAHEGMLWDTRHLLPDDLVQAGLKIPVARDYRVQYDEHKVNSQKSGVWLQGCNEATHGLSDTLLSILAVRAGELVRNIFGGEITNNNNNLR